MFTRTASLVLIGMSSAVVADTPPKVKLDILPAFNVSPSVKHFRKGEDLLVSPPYRLTATAPLTEYHGWYGDKNADQDNLHGWTVRVYRAASPKLLAAYAKAKDGYEARLNEGPEFLSTGEESYMYARFARKHFRWGDGVSFLSQSTQDAALYVPHNGHLQYAVWGITRDHRYTVVASVSVSHPKLAGWVSRARELRDARNLRELKRDKDYKLVERCSPDEFQTSLREFDRLIDALSFEETSNQAMQRTASSPRRVRPVADVLRVCHPRFGCVARFPGLAVADLVSR